MVPNRLYAKSVQAMLVILFYAVFTLLLSGAPTNIKVLVVFLKLSVPFCSSLPACFPDFGKDYIDSIRAPRHTASDYESMLNYTMSNFIKEAILSTRM